MIFGCGFVSIFIFISLLMLMLMKLLNLKKIHIPLIQTGPDLNSRDDVINPLA